MKNSLRKSRRVQTMSLPFILISAGFVLFPAACFSKSFSRTYFTMGTMMDITVFLSDEKKANRAMDDAYAEVQNVDKSASVYRENSEVAVLNRLPSGSGFAATPLFFNLLDASLNYSRMTDGAFDVTVFPLIKLWGFYDGKPPKKIPAKSKVGSVLGNVGFAALKLDKEKRSIVKHKNVQLDFGGIAKGYALDLAAKELSKSGIKNARIDFSSTTLYLGTPDSAPCYISAMAHPWYKNRTLFYMQIRDRAVSVSGSAENFFVYHGEKYSHIVNPKTGMPVKGNLLSAMAICKTAACADALSTALFVMGTRGGKRFLEQHPEVSAIFIEGKKQTLYIYASKNLKSKFALNEKDKQNAIISFF